MLIDFIILEIHLFSINPVMEVKKIRYTLIAGIFSGILFFPSCGENREDYLPSKDGKESVGLCFRLDASGKQGSRADNDEDPAYESHINIDGGDFKILLYNGEGNLIKVLTDAELVFDEDYVSKPYPLLEIELNETDDIYVAALINWESFGSDTKYNYPLFSSISDSGQGDPLDNLWTPNHEFSLRDSTPWIPSVGEPRLIPMFGLTKVNVGESIKTVNGREIIYVTIPVVRSLAKISFQVSDELFEEGFDIHECSISNYNKKGYFNPDMLQDGNSLNGGNNLQVGVPTCPSQEKISQPLMFTNIKDGNGKNKLVVYLPEMDNSNFTTDDDDRPIITASLSFEGKKSGEDKNIELSFGNSDDPSLYDVVRNHFYEYTVVDKNLTFKYTVCLWEKKETEIEFK